VTALFLSLFNLLSLGGSFVYQIFIGVVFGAGVELDSFFASSTVPQFLVLIFGGSMTFLLVPTFVSSLEKGGKEEIWNVLNNIINPTLFLYTLASGAIFLLSYPLIHLLNPGLSVEGKLLASELLRVQCIAMPFQMFSIIVSAAGNALRRYLTVALSTLAGLGGMLLFTILAVSPLGVRVLPYGVVTQSVVQAFFLYPLIKKGFIPKLKPLTPDFVNLYRKLSIAIGGSIYYKTDQFVDRFLVSYLPPGNITYLSYASRVLLSLGSIISSGLTTVAFTDLSSMKAKNQSIEYAEVFHKNFFALILIVVPLCFLFWLVGFDSLIFFLRRGKFTFEDISAIYVVALGFMGVLVAGTLGSLSANCFYAIQDVKTPTIIGTIGYSLGIILKILCFRWLGIIGVAIATSVYYGFNLAAQLLLLYWKAGVFRNHEVWKKSLYIVVASGIAASASKGFSIVLLTGTEPPLRVVISLFIFIGVYLLLLRKARFREIRLIVEKIGLGARS
jgi:putative peptidoglycan lipid II flippase